jgi:hypothetical protein
MPPRLALLVVAAMLSADPTAGDEIDDQLATIANVGREAAGSTAASAAAAALSQHDPSVLPRLLTAMQTTNPVAANWYRSVYESIVARELHQPEPEFPIAELRAFLLDAQHQGRVRRLALSLCDRLEPGYAAAFIPTRLDDPEFREDAVAAALAEAQAALDRGDKSEALPLLKGAFQHARTSDQVVRAADQLKALGEDADVVAHLGLVVDWWLIGPFDAPQFSGHKPDERCAGRVIARAIPWGLSTWCRRSRPPRRPWATPTPNSKLRAKSRPSCAAAPTTIAPCGSTAKRHSAAINGSTACASIASSRQ